MANVGAEIYKILRSKGYTPAQAAGVVGNARQESGLNPRASGGGLFQGIGGRSRLGRGNARQQVETALREEPAAWAALRRTHTPQEAARVFSQQFERPGTPMLGNRERYAGEAARQYAGLPPSSQQVSTGSLGPSAVAKLPGASFDQAGFQKAQKGAILGKLLRESGEAKDNPLFATGLVGGRMPQRSEYESEPKLPAPKGQVIKGQGTSTFVPPGADVANLKGVAHFDGKPVAMWIAPILKYAKEHGWKGTVNSGYRSFAEQTRIYNSGVRPAAKPGQSNHEGTEFPRGAVDVSDAESLARILRRSPYAHRLQWAGGKDPVHFSHPHGGSY